MIRATVKGPLVVGVALHSEAPRIFPGSVDWDNEICKMLNKKCVRAQDGKTTLITGVRYLAACILLSMRFLCLCSRLTSSP